MWILGNGYVSACFYFSAAECRFSLMACFPFPSCGTVGLDDIAFKKNEIKFYDG